MIWANLDLGQLAYGMRDELQRDCATLVKEACMGNRLIFELALANIPPGKQPFQPEDVYDFIESNLEGIESYQLNAHKVDAAAIDYTFIYVAGSISSVAAVLWMAYDRFIASRRRGPSGRGGIYVAIRRQDGSVKDFFIGEKYSDRDIFVGEFEASVTELLGDHDLVATHAKKIYALRQSGVWIRRK